MSVIHSAVNKKNNNDLIIWVQNFISIIIIIITIMIIMIIIISLDALSSLCLNDLNDSVFASVFYSYWMCFCFISKFSSSAPIQHSNDKWKACS